MSTYHETLTPLYRAFNARDIDAALSQMQSEVIWANGMEGGYVHGLPACGTIGRGNGA